jgi:hypothetical protein
MIVQFSCVCKKISTVVMVYSVCILDSVKLGLDYILDNCPSNINRKSERLQKDIMLVNKNATFYL